jgi:thiazole synthase
MPCITAMRRHAHIADMAEWLAFMRVRQVDFDHRQLDRFDRVVKRDRCVCVTSGVEQYCLCPGRLCLMQPVNQMPFMVGLAKVDVIPQCLRLIIQAARDIIQRVGPVNLRLSGPEEVEVGAVQNENDGAISQGYPRSRSCVRLGVIPIWPPDEMRAEMTETMTQAMITLTLNGESRRVAVEASVADLVREIGLDPAKVAVERNLEIVPRSTLANVMLAEGDQLEIVHFVGGGDHDDSWTVAGRTFHSRLIVGTGKYKDFEQNAAALVASGAEIITVAVRRVNVSDPKAPMLTDFIDPKKYTYLPNTAGCFTADDAIRTLRLAREAGGWDLVKLEVLGEAKTLYPDMRETLRATEVLAKEGFLPMVYCVDDPIAAKQLEDAGAVAVMPLGAPIGSGLGIQNRVTIRLIVEGAKVPVLVDAGVGTASDAAVGMELGCDGILMNTAIAEAKDPIRMARAMKLAVEGGREAYLAGRMGRRMYADPSSPLAGLI